MKHALALLGIGAWLFAAPASANGRFPRAQRFIEFSEDSSMLALAGTYGLIVTSDAGRSWSHVCEAATGTYSGEDPLLEILPGGKVVARNDEALVASGDSLCDWVTVHPAGSATVQDITRDPSRPSAILALVGTFDAVSGFASHLVTSEDAGAEWGPAIDLPVSSLRRGLSLDVAPSQPARLYVTGLDETGRGTLLVSNDGGARWEGRPLADTDSNSAPYLAQVSAKDPARLFVRTDTYSEIDGIDTANDALLLSVDSGATFTTLIRRKAKLLGFALSPDESVVLAGYGDPVVEGTYVEPADLGIYRARVADLLADPAHAEDRFEKIFEASVTCLRFTPAGLYACTSQSERGYEVGRAANADFVLADSEPFTPLLALPSLRPLACPAGTGGRACYTDTINGFPGSCELFGAPCDVGPPPDRPADAGIDASIAPPAAGGAGSSGGARPVAAGGSSGAPGVAGGGGAPDAGPATAGGGAGEPPRGAASDSCGCRTPARAGDDLTTAWLLALLAVRRRRRTR